jgi:aspartate 1-decarboxylase
MKRIMLKSKIHRATVTDTNLDYEGSLTLDEELMEASGILEHEQVDIYNISNGQRFHTYVIKGKRGTGEVCLNGASARLGCRGDLIIICSYALYDEKEVLHYRPVIVHLNSENQVIVKGGGD